MSKPLTADQQIAALKKFGIRYVETPGWRTRFRDASHGPYGPMNGFMVHHTGDDASDQADLNVLINGREGLPGPLVQYGIDHEGVVHLIANGRSNHAGGGDPRVLDQVENESYDRYPSPSRFHDGSPDEADGNSHFYGVEIFYSGSHKMTSSQAETVVLLAAAICDAHGWSGKSVIGHKEWSDWKSDPGQFDMHTLREAVTARVKAGKPKPAPVKRAPAATPRPNFVKMHAAADDLATAAKAALAANSKGSSAYNAAAAALNNATAANRAISSFI